MLESFQHNFSQYVRSSIPTWNVLLNNADSGNVGGNISELPPENDFYVACNDEFFVQGEDVTVNLFTVQDIYNTMFSQIVYPTEILEFNNNVGASDYGSLTCTKVRDVTFYKDTDATEDFVYGEFEPSPENWFDYRCVAELHQEIVIIGLRSDNIPVGDFSIVLPDTIGGKPVVALESKWNSVLVGSVYEQIHHVISLKSNTLPALPVDCFLNCTSLQELWLPNCQVISATCVSGCTALTSMYFGNFQTSILKNAFSGSSSFNIYFPAGNDFPSTLSDETLTRDCYPAETTSPSRWFVEEKKTVTMSDISSVVTAIKTDVDTKLNNTALFGTIATSSEDFGYTEHNDVAMLKIDYVYDPASNTDIVYVLDDSGVVDGSNDTVVWKKYTETKVETIPVVSDSTRFSSCTVRVVKFTMDHIKRLFVSFNDNSDSITAFKLYVSDTEPTTVTNGTDVGDFENNTTNNLDLQIDYTSTTGNIYIWLVPTISVVEANIIGYSYNMDGYPAIEIDPITGETSLPIMLPPYGYAYSSSVNLTRSEEDYPVYSPWNTFPSQWIDYTTYTVGLDQFVSITGLKTSLLPAGLTNIDIIFPSTIDGKTVGMIADNFNSDSYSGVEIHPISSIKSTTITYIGDSAFKNCTSLLSVDVSSLTEVGIDSFYGCGCTFYNVPSLVTIGDGAFAEAGTDVLLYLGSTVPSIGADAFGNSSGLTALYPYGADDVFTMYNFGSLFDASPSSTDFVYCIPYTTAIKGATFNLVSVTFDAGQAVFMNGESTCIRKYKIGEAYNSFPTVSEEFFIFNGWLNYPNLPVVSTNLANQVVTYLTADLADDYFIYTLNSGNASYSLSSLMAGVADWSPFDLTIPTTYNSKPVTKISDSFNSVFDGGSTYNNKYKINKVTGSSILEVGTGAFRVSAGQTAYLNEIDLPSCTEYKDYCFSCNTGLESISSSTLTNIGASCFYYCTSISSVTLPNVLSVSNGCFQECTALTTVSMDSCTTLGTSSFYLCNSLTSVSMDNCTSVGAFCFTYCENLNFNLPSVSSCGNVTFAGCGGGNCYLPSLVSLTGVSDVFSSMQNGTNLWLLSITELGQYNFQTSRNKFVNVYFGDSVPTFTPLGYVNSFLTLRYPSTSTAWATELGGATTWHGIDCLPYTP